MYRNRTGQSHATLNEECRNEYAQAPGLSPYDGRGARKRQMGVIHSWAVKNASTRLSIIGLQVWPAEAPLVELRPRHSRGGLHGLGVPHQLGKEERVLADELAGLLLCMLLSKPLSRMSAGGPG